MFIKRHTLVPIDNILDIIDQKISAAYTALADEDRALSYDYAGSELNVFFIERFFYRIDSG